MIIWYIKGKRWFWDGNEYVDVPMIYGKKDCAIEESRLTDDWLLAHGYRSEGAATRGLGSINWREKTPCRDREAYAEYKDVEAPPLRYKIYRCFEIVILDKDGNQVGESDYVYTSRKDAEDMAIHKLKMEG